MVQGAGLGELRVSMSWIRKSPFADGTDPAVHMVALIAAEAQRTGAPLSEADKQILLANWDPETTVPEDFRAKARKLIEQTFDHEADPDNARNLGNSAMWAGEVGYPTIVALTEEVMLERGERSPLRGRRWMVDRAQLIGCGFASVILLMLFAALIDWLFGHH